MSTVGQDFEAIARGGLRHGSLHAPPSGTVPDRPVADGECHVLLFEPAFTLNTGDVRSERTVELLERI